MKKLRVLVVDDTIVYRKVVSDILSEIPGVEVVGVAHNGKIALDKIRMLKPDLITLDIEMPVMNGIDTLEAMQKIASPPGVVMLSTLTAEGSEMTMRALELGAFDFILKPQSTNPTDGKNQLKNALKPIISAFKLRRPTIGGLGARAAQKSTRTPAPVRQAVKPMPGKAGTAVKRRGKSEIVTIGISTGGPNALTAMLPKLPRDIGVPILIVQHMPPVFTASLASSLNKKCALEVKEAVDREPIKPNVVYIAPGGKQMKLSAATDGVDRLIKITNDPPENSCKPAADYLFRSVGDYFVGRTTAVIMTGMGSDGTKGLQVLKNKGAYIIGQDESSCVVYGMPKAAADAGVLDTICPLTQIASEIVKSVKG